MNHNLPSLVKFALIVFTKICMSSKCHKPGWFNNNHRISELRDDLYNSLILEKNSEELIDFP